VATEAAAWYNPESDSGDAVADRIPRSPVHPPSRAACAARAFSQERTMAKPHRSLKKANHGSRPANSKARKAKRKHIRT